MVSASARIRAALSMTAGSIRSHTRSTERIAALPNPSSMAAVTGRPDEWVENDQVARHNWSGDLSRSWNTICSSENPLYPWPWQSGQGSTAAPWRPGYARHRAEAISSGDSTA
jgi:hypothetical protein